MSFKTILTLLDGAEDSPKRLDAACGLADAHSAHLKCLAMTQQLASHMAISLHAASSMVDYGQIEKARKAAQSLASAAKQKLDASGNLGEARWASSELFGLREVLGIEGRHSDLIVAGQAADKRCPDLREAALEGALFSSGRPVLLVPANWDNAIIARHVIVAWDGSRESARAVNDAAPFLDRAEKITIVVVDPMPGFDGLGPDPGADIATVLARHCSNVELDQVSGAGASIAVTVLRRAREAAGDLIVMGGYGHSMTRETIFGGVSREMIAKTTIPLLLSH